MISAKRIAQLAKKCQRTAVLRRKRLTMMAAKEAEVCSNGSGRPLRHVHTDGRQFEVPVAYLGTTVSGELLRMSQEEFGFISEDGRIKLPCDATMMEYIMCLLRRNASAEVEKALLSSMAMPCNYARCVAPSLGANQQVAVCSS